MRQILLYAGARPLSVDVLPVEALLSSHPAGQPVSELAEGPDEPPEHSLPATLDTAETENMMSDAQHNAQNQTMEGEAVPDSSAPDTVAPSAVNFNTTDTLWLQSRINGNQH